MHFLNLKPVLGSFPWPENILLVWTSLLLMWRTRLLKNTKQWHFHPVLYFSFTLFFLSLITFLTACYPNSSASALTLLLFEDQSGCELLLQFEFFHSTKVLNSFCFSQLAILHLKLYSYHFANFFFFFFCFVDVCGPVVLGPLGKTAFCRIHTWLTRWNKQNRTLAYLLVAHGGSGTFLFTFSGLFVQPVFPPVFFFFFRQTGKRGFYSTDL